MLLFGTGGLFTRTVFASLLEAGVRPVALVTAARGTAPAWPALPVEVTGRPGDAAQAARRQGIPVLYWYLGEAAVEVARRLAGLAPDYCLVACFPQRLPGAMLGLARIEFLNLHPSLLPAYRGPEPLFRQFRAGEADTGICLHRVEQALDAGPILARAREPLADGISGPEAEALLARRGAALFVELLDGAEAPLAEVQDEARARWAPPPGPADFDLDPSWSARRAFNFMRGTAHWGRPYRIAFPGRTLLLGQALAFSSEAALDTPWAQDGETVRLRLACGVLHACLYGAPDTEA